MFEKIAPPTPEERQEVWDRLSEQGDGMTVVMLHIAIDTIIYLSRGASAGHLRVAPTKISRVKPPPPPPIEEPKNG